MANSSKKKGDRAELEVQGILRDLLGVPARSGDPKLWPDEVDDLIASWRSLEKWYA